MGHSERGIMRIMRYRVPNIEETKLHFIGEALGTVYEPVRRDNVSKELDKLLEKIK